jgi:prepilin-type processing-associated H-X9-DG protein
VKPPSTWDASQVNAPPKKSSTGLWIALGVFIVGGCFCCGIGGAILFPVFAQARKAATQTLCLSNVKQLDLAMLLYVNDNNDSFPAANVWADKMEKGNYMVNRKPVSGGNRALYKCPSVTSGYGYAMNDKMTGMNTEKVDGAITLLLFESNDTSWDAHGNPADQANPPRHGNRNNVGYADGHAKSVNPSSITGN